MGNLQLLVKDGIGRSEKTPLGTPFKRSDGTMDIFR